ncbi:MAG: hypothetical protein RL745_980 [Actinomycetota bacterium]
MAKTYDNFFSWVLPEVAGCPEITAIQAIRDTVIDFCEKTMIHQADHDPVSVTAKIPDYDLETPVTGTRIVKVMKAWHKGEELIPSAPDQVRDPTVYNQRIGGVVPSYSTPKFFIQKDPNSISLLPIPAESVSSALTMRVALAPLRSSTGCDDQLFEQWVEQIASGAVAKLQLSSGKPYSNPQAASVNQARYMAGVNAARQMAVRGWNRSSLSVQLRKI